MAARAFLPLWVFVVCGLVDGVLGLSARTSQGLVAAEVLALLPVTALWLSLGCLLWWVYEALLALSLGPAARLLWHERIRDFLPQLWRERRTRDSRRLGAAVVASLCGLTAFLVISVLVGRYLIENRHDATLIAVALVGIQLGLLAGCIWLTLTVRRMVLALADLAAQSLNAPLLLSAPSIFIALLTVFALACAWLIKHQLDTLLAIDAFAPALFVVSLASFIMIRSATTARAPAWHWLLVLSAVVTGALVGLRSPIARSFTNDHTLVAKYLLAELRKRSDFDKDGTPWFPAGEDCAPFDPKRHPFMLEKPRNGIDENCDGVDDLPQDIATPTRRPKPDHKIEPKPNLVLITMDATRADHMGFLGYKDHPTTPHLDALAKKSTIFTSAFSQDSGTGPSTWSLMSGRTPFQVKLSSAKRFPFSISQDEVLLAEALSAAGYQTSAALCGSMFASRYWNIRRGFAQYAEVCGKKVSSVAEQTATEALARLKALRSDRPFFFWVHFLDPHYPYTDQPNVSFGRTPIDRYDEEIRVTDAAVGRILQALAELPAGRATYVAVSADHGENFGEHGTSQHARTLYREVTHVPLVIAGPDVKARRVTAPVASGDLYPTFLELASVPIPRRCTMTSQFNVLFGARPDRTRLVFQENSFSLPVRHVKAVISDRYHLLFDTSNQVLELYDWRADPKERLNLYGEGSADESRLRQALLLFLTTTQLPEELKE